MDEHRGVASEGEISAFQLRRLLITEGLQRLQILVVLFLCEFIEVLKVSYLLSFLGQVKLVVILDQVESQTRILGG